MFDEKFWLALAFLGFLAISFKLIIPHIIKILDGKSKKIAEDILEAKNLREKAQKLLEEAQIFHKHSVEKAQKIITEALEEAKKIEENAKDQLEKQIDAIKKTALDRIKTEQEFAIRQVKTQIVEEAVKQFSSINFEDSQHHKIIEKALDKVSRI